MDMQKSPKQFRVPCFEKSITFYQAMIKNITLSADSQLIEKARKKATEEKTTLNKRFQAWLEMYTTSKEELANSYDQLMLELKEVKIAKGFTRKGDK